MSGWAEHLKLRFSRVFQTELFHGEQWQERGRIRQVQNSNCGDGWMDGWMMRKDMCDQKNRRWECRGGEICGGKRERTLPAAAVGGPNGEMREGWDSETKRKTERERERETKKDKGWEKDTEWDTEREEEFCFFFHKGRTSIWETGRERVRKRENTRPAFY